MSVPEPSVSDFAAALSARGYKVYPVNVWLDENGDKQLRFKDDRWAAGDYPTDPVEITEHWDGFSGIMINTGMSGLVVVDVDIKNGKDGFAALAAKGITLPPTPVVVRTWSGGQHLFYREPAGMAVKTSQNELADGVDIRARGGIAIAPPTTVDSKPYRFEDAARVVPVSELPEFPRELAERLGPKGPTVPTSTTRPVLTADQRHQMERRLERILRDLEHMEDGNRNGTMRLRLIRLFGIGMTLGEDPEAVAALARESYFRSGGSSERELDSFIEWAQAHAEFEVPSDETDEAFEAEVARLLRDQQIREEVRRRLSPVRVHTISDEDVLEFDPHAAEDDYWVDGLLPKGETVILFGTPSAGKSFASIDLACGLATGTAVWGERVDQARVLYLAGEGTRRLAVRKRAWEVFHELEAADVQLRKMRLVLDSDDSVGSHQRLVERERADLIVVDTLMRASEGLSLEDPTNANRVIAQLDRIREARPKASIVVLHHPPESNLDKPSGAYPLRGNVDTIFKLVKERNIRTLSVAKAKEDDMSWRRQFTLRDINIPGSRFSSAVFVPEVSSTRQVLETNEDDFRRRMEDPFN